ncbi:hypothetical protein Tco_0432614 [Tanacetum coccineum]
MFQNLKRNLNKPGDVNGKSANPNFGKNTDIPILGEEDSIFMEIPKPKAKKTVNLDPNPNSYPSKLPYPERMKVREHDKPSAQHSRFLKMFKQLRLEIGLKEALVEFDKSLTNVKLVAKKTREACGDRYHNCECECYDIIMNKVSRETRRSGKISYPMKLELELTPTRMTLELANRSISHPMGIAEDVVVRVDDDPFSGSTTTHSDDPSPSSSPVKTSDNFVKFADELAPLDSLPGNDDSTLKKDLHEENFQEDVEIKNSNVSDKLVFLNTPLSDKDECFAPEDDNDEIDDFLAIEVSSNLEEGYFDSEGDIAFLDNLLSDDVSHNLDSKVTSDHEPEQNESSITFSPRSDPLHHEFAGEPLTLPARNNLIESLPMSPILVEDSEPTQEEIDILLVPDNLIPPGVEDADSEDEVNESPNLDHQDDPSIPRPPPEPPDIKKCFEPKAGILIIKEFKGVSKSHDFMTSILPTLVSDLPFISSIVSFENEDTIFDLA